MKELPDGDIISQYLSGVAIQKLCEIYGTHFYRIRDIVSAYVPLRRNNRPRRVFKEPRKRSKVIPNIAQSDFIRPLTAQQLMSGRAIPRRVAGDSNEKVPL